MIRSSKPSLWRRLRGEVADAKETITPPPAIVPPPASTALAVRPNTLPAPSRRRVPRAMVNMNPVWAMPEVHILKGAIAFAKLKDTLLELGKNVEGRTMARLTAGQVQEYFWIEIPPMGSEEKVSGFGTTETPASEKESVGIQFQQIAM